jgi:protein-disulfide isomerase
VAVNYSTHWGIMKKSLLLAAVILFVGLAFAQEPVNPALRPPKGAQVAIVVFEDLECPDCRRASPLLEEAAKTYKIPLVIHDFPLPFHQWSFDAAVTARYFDSHSKLVGNQYRDYIFEHQPEITKDNLRAFSEKFATEHKIDLPFVVDPQGKFAKQVTDDRDLGKDVKIGHTPTIYVVSNKTQGKPFVEVVDRTQLYQLIDAMKTE